MMINVSSVTWLSQGENSNLDDTIGQKHAARDLLRMSSFVIFLTFISLTSSSALPEPQNTFSARQVLFTQSLASICHSSPRDRPGLSSLFWSPLKLLLLSLCKVPISNRCLWKLTFILAIASVETVGELCPLVRSLPCMCWWTDNLDLMVEPRVSAQGHITVYFKPIDLAVVPVVSSLHPTELLNQTVAIWSSDQLFICYTGKTCWIPLSKQSLAHGGSSPPLPIDSTYCDLTLYNVHHILMGII